MPIELKTKNLNWPSLQGTVLGGGAYSLERFASADENTATFETRTGGERASKALVRLAQADEETGELQLLVWQAIKKSGHPNLVPIWGTGRARINGTSLIYVVMEASDENLGSALEERALEPAEAGEILVSLVGALGHLHSHGFVHGGLAPEQVMAVGESIKIATGGVRRIGSLAGLDFAKAKYRAPESAEGNISPAADIWCLGATLLQALTQRVCNENFLEEAAKLPPPFDAIAKSCLQTDPVARGTLAHLLAIYDGTAAKTPVASAAGTATKTMAAAAGSSRGSISFDWDAAEAPEVKDASVKPMYLPPGPLMPEAEAFAAEAAAGPAVKIPPEGEDAISGIEVASTTEAVGPVAPRATCSDDETTTAEISGAMVAAPSEELVELDIAEADAPETGAGETEALTNEASSDAASNGNGPVTAERPREATSYPAWMTTRPKGNTGGPDVNESDPVAAANARLMAWREAAAAATGSQYENNGPSARTMVVDPEEIRRAKRRAWVFVAVAILILLAVIWVLRPSRSVSKIAQTPPQTAREAGTSSREAAPEPNREQRAHGRTMTLPAAGQNGRADTAVASAPTSSPGAETSGSPDAAAASMTAAAKAGNPGQDAGPAGRGPVWRVILYTYHRETDAKRRVATITRRHPDLNAEVFTPSGEGKSPFLVSIGGSKDRDAMAQLRRTAMRFGLPRDSYLQNYSR